MEEAGLREARLDDARHTAATVLLALRQPTPTVMSLMGWSSESMAARYQHVTDAMRTEVASQVGELIWQPGTTGIGLGAVLVRGDSLATVLMAAEEQARRRAGRTSLRRSACRPRSPNSAQRWSRARQRRKLQLRQKLRQGGPSGHERQQAASRYPSSAWRRMRDSNSGGVAPNTLSNTAGLCSLPYAGVRDQARCPA